MGEVIVTGDEPASNDRELGKAEGAAEVHADEAADQAERATEAAEAAAAAADMNITVAAAAADNAERAEEAAEVAGFAEKSVLDALSAQTIALQSLTEEMRAQREAAQSAPAAPRKESAPKADRQPAAKPRFRDRYNQR